MELLRSCSPGEGLAGAGSVIAVVQISAQIITTSGGYLADVSHAREEIEDLQIKRHMRSMISRCKIKYQIARPTTLVMYWSSF